MPIPWGGGASVLRWVFGGQFLITGRAREGPAKNGRGCLQTRGVVMGRDTSRIARVLGELAELGRRIGERAEELAALAAKGAREEGASAPGNSFEVAASATQLAATAANLAGVQNRGESPRLRAGAPATKPAATSNPAGRSRVRPGSTPPLATKRGPIIPAEGRRRARPVGPVLVSTAMHLVVLVGLALIFVARDAKTDPFVITADRPAETLVEEFSPLEFEAAESAEELAEAPPEPALADLAPLSEPVVIDEMAVSADLVAIDTSDVVPVSFDSSDILATVGGAAGGEASGGGGAGNGAGGGAAGAPTFFGRKGQGKSVCFVCDNSNSYRDGGFHTVLAEVARAVDALQPTQSFFVIFFSDAAYPMFHPERLDTLQSATRENKQRLQAWLGTVEMCSGGQGIHDAVKLAASLDADVVYFLSDGEHQASVVDRVKGADFGDTAVHTFGMQQNLFDKRTGAVDPTKARDQQGFNQNLIDIATAHDGSFTPVVVPPQAAVLEQHRPIRKNRSRGPVWGLKL